MRARQPSPSSRTRLPLNASMLDRATLPTPSPARGPANAPNRAVKQYLAERRLSRPNRSPCVADRRLNRDLCRREGQAWPLSGTRTAPPLPIRAPAVSSLPSVDRDRLDEVRDHAVSPRVKRRRGWWTATGRLSVCRVHPGRRRTNPRARHVPPQALPTLLEIYWREGRRPPAQCSPTRVARPSLRRPPPRAPAAPHRRFALVDPQPLLPATVATPMAHASARSQRPGPRPRC